MVSKILDMFYDTVGKLETFHNQHMSFPKIQEYINIVKSVKVRHKGIFVEQISVYQILNSIVMYKIKYSQNLS